MAERELTTRMDLQELLGHFRVLIREEVARLHSALGPRADERREWFDAKGAATYIGVHPKTLASWARDGKLPSYKLGSELRFRRGDLDRHIEAGRVRPVLKVTGTDG